MRLSRKVTNSSTDYLYNYSGNPKKPIGDKRVEVNDTQFLPGLLDMQRENEGYSTSGSTQNLQDAAEVFKFAADNSKAEWRLDIYDDKGEKTAVVATKQDADHVQNADAARVGLSVKGIQVTNIHSHPSPLGTKGGSSDDMRNAKHSPTRNAVYFKANQTLYEYNSTQSQIKEMPTSTSDDILKQMGLK